MSKEHTSPLPAPPATLLPPISMFTQPSSILPASPPQNYDNNKKPYPLSILPKPRQEYFHPDSPDQQSSSSLWALFHQFQQQQQQQQDTQKQSQESRSSSSDRRHSDSNSNPISSEEVLAEKRRRNAGASARFRDRRKQRERDLQDKCNALEKRAKELEFAIKRLDPEHPLIDDSNIQKQQQSNGTDLGDRVGQLEHMMIRFRQEKETDTQKLLELEKENKYLKSLLVPVSLPRNTSRKRSHSPQDSSISKRRHHHHHYSNPSSPSSSGSSEEAEEEK